MQTELSRPTDTRRFPSIRRTVWSALGLGDGVPLGLDLMPDSAFPDDAIPDFSDEDEAEMARRSASELLQRQDDAQQRAAQASDIASRLVLPRYLRDAEDAATRRWWARDYAAKAPRPVRDSLAKLANVVRCFEAIANGWGVTYGDDARALREAVVSLRKLARHFDAAAEAEHLRADRAYRVWRRQCLQSRRRVMHRPLRCNNGRARRSRTIRTAAKPSSTSDPDSSSEPPGRRDALQLGGAS